MRQNNPRVMKMNHRYIVTLTQEERNLYEIINKRALSIFNKNLQKEEIQQNFS